MDINFIKVGYLRCNCYFIMKDNKYLIVDPGDDLELIEEYISGKNICTFFVQVVYMNDHFTKDL